MTSIKDKLASSVRQAKPGAEPASSGKAEADNNKVEANKTPRSTSANSTKKASVSPPADSLAAEPPPSIEELFPDRIWPD
jgi:hypothetical protein